MRHRYVHGGFTDTDLRFSMYFPPAERYEGRFLQPVMHIAGDENVATTGELAGLGNQAIQFAFDSGGYLVESNQGSTLMMGPPDITGFRASAATAQYSRMLAEEMYGEHRPYGYVTGGSGGAYKTMACYENAPDVWDGAVPFINGCHVSMPNVFTVQAHAFRLLDGVFDQIVDAVEPGGGDMYAGLDDEQRAALEEVTRMGFPPRAWFAHDRIALSYTGVFAAIFGILAMGDPTYFEDFWTVPGYLGADPPESLLAARIQCQATVAAIVTTDEVRTMGLPGVDHGRHPRLRPGRAAHRRSPRGTAAGRVPDPDERGGRRPAHDDHRRARRPGDARVRRDEHPRARDHRAGRHRRDRQLRLPRRPDLPPSPGSGARVPGVGPVQGARRHPPLPAATDRQGLRPGRRGQLLAERRLHVQGDLGQLPDGRGRLPLAGRLVPPAGDRRSRGPATRTATGSGSSTGPCT